MSPYQGKKSGVVMKVPDVFKTSRAVLALRRMILQPSDGAASQFREF